MERIYSAFFTSERRREPSELTAEALELHNESQQQQHAKDGASAPGRPPSGFERGLDPEFPRGGGRGDGGETDADAKRYGPARREELRRMVVNGASVKQDLQAACQAAVRAFLLAYGAKAFTAVLLASRKWSSLEYGYADAARLLLRGDTLRFGAFFGSLVGVFRVTELGVRAARGGQRDAINLAIAGAVSGSALLLDSPSRRSTISLYIFVRMLDVVCRHLVSIGAVPTWRYSSECLFALSNAAIMYGFIVDPSLLPQVRFALLEYVVMLCVVTTGSCVDWMLDGFRPQQGYYQWICRIGAVNHYGLEYTVRQRMHGQLDVHGQPLPFRLCQPHYHMYDERGLFGQEGTAAMRSH
ncbi:hypothetical protein BBJ28_00020779 [Nothophytophthora sp. Chile5]|nr:hypothetical protein BBJ28_00020779 [Nothophytophthora sp. Chile5]